MKEGCFYFKVILLIFIGCFFVPTISSAATLRLPPNNSGLVGYWSFDEGSGTIAHDQSGNRKNATINGTTWISGKKNNALQFNGSSDYASVALDLSSTNQVTVSFWFYTTSYNNFDSLALEFTPNTNSANGFMINPNNSSFGGGTFVVGFHNTTAGNYNLVSFARPSTSFWHHVVVVMDKTQAQGSKVTPYVDGVPVSYTTELSGVDSANFDNSNLYFMSRAGTSLFMSGKLDDVRIYNRVLSSTEISKLYQSGSVSVKAPTNTGLVGYWSFDEGSGTVTHDQSGNGKNGSFTNSPTWTNGKYGKALQFNGSNDSVDSSSFSWAGGPVTVSFWNYVASADVQQSSAFGVGINSGGGNRFQAHVPWSDHTLYWDYGNITGAGRISTDYTNYENKWTYVTLVSAGSGGGFKAIYLNGVQVTSSGTSDNPTNLNGFYLGAYYDTTNYFHKGKIDDFRIYNRVLSATEIQSLYKSGAIVNNASTNTKLTNGLVGLWSFNGPDLNGTTAYDRSGQGNNGTLTNSPTVTFGKTGQALSFNGTSQGVNIGAVSTTATNNLTFSAWMYSASNSDTGVIYYNGKSDADGYGFVMNLNSSCSNTTDHHIAILLGGVTCDVLGSSYVLPTNQWVHVVGVRDSGTWKLYANGVLQTTGGTTAPNTPFTRSGIGSNGNASNFFPGKIDEVRVYNRALSASEISQLYNMAK